MQVWFVHEEHWFNWASQVMDCSYNSHTANGRPQPKKEKMFPNPFALKTFKNPFKPFAGLYLYPNVKQETLPVNTPLVIF